MPKTIFSFDPCKIQEPIKILIVSGEAFTLILEVAIFGYYEQDPGCADMQSQHLARALHEPDELLRQLPEQNMPRTVPRRNGSGRALELLAGVIEPYDPKASGGGKPYPVETMPRIHLLQNWLSLNDPAMEKRLSGDRRDYQWQFSTAAYVVDMLRLLSCCIVMKRGVCRRWLHRGREVRRTPGSVFGQRQQPSARSSIAKRRRVPRLSILSSDQAPVRLCESAGNTKTCAEKSWQGGACPALCGEWCRIPRGFQLAARLRQVDYRFLRCAL